MNRLMRIVYLWLLLCAVIQVSNAQRYPITGNLVVLPPYSPYLTDMSNSIPDRINLSLLLLDANEPLEQIGLRLKINGPGISLETRPTFRPNPIDLSYNIPTQLSGFELAEYFDPQNLRIEGLGLFQRTQFLNNPTLPEGLYTMCFEAFDYRRFDEAAASDEICFMFTIMIHEPPIIITPIGEQTPTEPQNLLFTWIPQHVGNFITNYTLYLYERTNPNDAPINVINGGGILIDSFQTMINSYNYTGVDPLLEYGTEYVIRVRAFDIDGAQVFDNLGYSPIEMFTYGGDCTAPFDLQGTPTESGEILLTWEGELPDLNPGNGGSQTQTTASNTIGRTRNGGGTTPANSSPLGEVSVGNTTNPISGGLNPITSSPTSGSTSSNSGNTSGQFIIEYRNINSASGDWQRAYTFENTYTIPGMEMGQSYEVRVGLLCWGSIEIWSDIIEVQMPDFYCGIQPPSHDLTNSLLNSLVSGDSVYAGDFKVTINEVYGGSNGRFTGTGYISVPYLNFARINVDFIAATFNEEYRLVDGFFDVKGIGAQGLGGDWLNWLDMLLEAVETLDDFLDLESMISGQISELITFANTFMPPDIAQQLQDAQDALDNATTDQEIQDAMDDLNDAINAFNEAMEELLNASYVVFFENNGQSKYGHDRKASGSNEIATNYEDAFTIGGGSNDSVRYTPDWKSVKTGDTESLKAVLDRELSNLSLWPDNTTFKTLDGTILPSSIYPDEDSISLTINGSTHENIVDVFAVENYTDADGNPLQHIAGKMKVLTLDPIEKKVWIVPVNGAEYPSDPAAVESELNKVFKGAAVNWTVQQINGFTSSFDDTMDDDDSGLWSTLTGEMKDIRSDFRDQEYNVDEDEEYILFICKYSEDVLKNGYMPRASNYGYLFSNAIDIDELLFKKTVAHELAHGAFHLKHTWLEHGGAQEKGSTDNLMDSKEYGLMLRKWQWLFIHNPQGGSGLFSDDEDDEFETKIASACLPDEVLQYIGDDKTFKNMYGEPITLQSDMIPFQILDGDDPQNGWVNGGLARIIYKNTVYSNWYTPKANEPNVNAGWSWHGCVRFEGDERSDCLEDYNIDAAILPGELANVTDLRVAKNSGNCEIKVEKPQQSSQKFNNPCGDCFKLVHNFTDETIADQEGLEELLRGEKDFSGTNRNYQVLQSIFFFSKNDTTGLTTKVKDAYSPTGYVKIWLHKNSDDKWELIPVGNDQLAPQLLALNQVFEDHYGDGTTFFSSIGTALGNGFNGMANGIYRGLDWISKGIGGLKIDKKWWNCDDPSYDGTYAQVVEIMLAPALVAILYVGNDYFKMDLLEESLTQVGQVGFAFVCGVWDGVIETGKGLVDAINIIPTIMSPAGRAKIKTLITKMQSYVRVDDVGKPIVENGDTLGGIYYCVVDGLTEQFDPNKPCQFTHNVTEIALPIVLAFYTGGASAAGSASSMFGRIITVIAKIDQIADRFNVVSYVAGAAGRQIFVVAKNGTKMLFKSINTLGTRFEVNLTYPNGNKVIETIDDVDLDRHYVDVDGKDRLRAKDQPENPAADPVINKIINKLLTRFAPIKDFIVDNRIFSRKKNADGTSNGDQLAEITETNDGFLVDATNGPDIDYSDVLPSGTRTVEEVNIKIKDGDDIIEVVGDVELGPKNAPAHCLYGKHLCLLAGTPVKMDGFYHKSIEDIQIGDIVESYDHKTDLIFGNEVEELYEDQSNQVVKIHINGEQILTTPDHLFWIPNKSHWKLAKYLKKGDQLVSKPIESYSSIYSELHPPRSDLEIDSIRVIDSLVSVYNIQLSKKPFTYLVGHNAILTTDKCFISALKNKLGVDLHAKIRNIATSQSLTTLERIKFYKYLNELSPQDLNKIANSLDDATDDFQKAIADRFRKDASEAVKTKADDLIGNIKNRSADWVDFVKTKRGYKAYDFLDDSKTIRKNIDNLQNLDIVLHSKIYELTEGITEAILKGKINQSGYKKDLIDNLKKASGDGSDGNPDFSDVLKADGRTLTNPLVKNPIDFPDAFPGNNFPPASTELLNKIQNRIDETDLTQKVKLSEEIGEMRADIVMPSKGYVKESFNVPGKQGQFDRMYVKKDANGNIIEVAGIEAKGTIANGKEMFGSRKTALDEIAQQGTSAYRDDIIKYMISNMTGNTKLKLALQQVQAGAVPFKYILVKQKSTSALDYIVKIFDE